MQHPLVPTRRRWLGSTLGATLATALGAWSSLSVAAGPARGGAAGANRFVFVILRGGLDGLSAVPAVGDPSFAPARGALAQFGSAPLPLDATFALHPALANLHAMHGRGELTVLHAVGLAYRDRSHFDAQQVLESGSARPFELATGWLGRALADSSAKGLALNTAVPLVLRGPGIVDTWAPSVLPEPAADLVARLARLYANDPQLATALARAQALHLDGAMPAAMADTGMAAGAGGNFTRLAQRAAEFIAQPQGPQAAVLELGGWDTHANQAAANGALANGLRQLDTGLGALREGLLPSGTWGRTVVVVATEFGREVAINGTLGTDHGTGAAAFVLGGAVAGGKVFADWPGLAKADRNDGRDLKITTDIRAVLKGVLADHLELGSKRLNAEVFPGSDAVRGLSLLKG